VSLLRAHLAPCARRGAALALAAALAGVPTVARAAPALSLRQALTYARGHRPSLAAARARVEVARAQVGLPAAAAGVRVVGAAELLLGTSNNSTASYATLGALDVARIGGSPANAPASWRPEPSTLVGVSAHKLLYDFGRAAAQADTLDALALAAEEGARGAQLDLELEVEDAFYAALGAREVLAAATAAAGRAAVHRDFAQARVTAQLMPPIELARAEADVARYEVERVRASGAVAAAQAGLAAAIGADDAQVEAGADDLARAAPSIDAKLGDALDRAPEVGAARAQLLAQQRQTAAIGAERAPTIDLSAEVTARAGGAAVAANPSPVGGGWLPAIPNWDALVVLSWPLHDPVIAARADVARRQERVRAAELAQVSDQLRAIIARRGLDLEVAAAALAPMQRAVDAATANHAQAEARFRGGLGTAVELSDAEALLTDAQIQLAVGRFQLARARAHLARALAEPTP
jgi:outer membrane protein